ncbi:MAG: PLP-dependent aminotransferase family protein [Roseburia sp.]|nr:PLP-dependent aminotransferase family protein [Roseburia sp.]MCM1098958.1 PLP-dependent aminotransferase family protein [Ruminococcus flavefaciens]
MTIRLQADSRVCLYEQIYEHIRNEIRDGKLLEGERLPSTRSLAEYLQVSRSTVDYAYGQLLDEGYIEARPCRGYFVSLLEELPEAREKSPVETESGREKREVWEYDFSPYDIDLSGFPFGVWKKITKNILTDANSELFARGGPQGDAALRLTISRYLHSSRGVNCRPEQIIVGAGNDYLLMLLEKILGPGRRVAMENPTYARSYRIFRSFLYDIVTVDMDEGGMKVRQLEKEEVSTVYVMPSHQFPAGTVMPIGRRLELLKWAGRAEGRYVIEDDYDSEFRYHGKPIPALQASDDGGRVIYLGSFSKSIAPAIRVSFMVLPESLLEKYNRDCRFYSCTVSRIDQSILNEFIRDGYFERHLNKMRKIYRAKHELLLNGLKSFQDAFAVSGENAGLHLLLTSKRGMAEEEMIRRAAGQGVRVYGLTHCMREEEEENPAASGQQLTGEQRAGENGTVLLGFGGLSREQIEEGLSRLKNAWL